MEFGRQNFISSVRRNQSHRMTSQGESNSETEHSVLCRKRTLTEWVLTDRRTRCSSTRAQTLVRANKKSRKQICALANCARTQSKNGMAENSSPLAHLRAQSALASGGHCLCHTVKGSVGVNKSCNCHGKPHEGGLPIPSSLQALSTLAYIYTC